MLHLMIQELAGNDSLSGIGAAIGGPLDWRRGIVSPLHQPQWRDVPLKNIMEEKWGCPFWVDVDTNVAALGEYYLGADRPERFMYITLSTGMGGGFLINGKIYRGLHGEHPEVGHQSIPFHCAFPERVKCECGVTDCLEALVSGNAIKRIYHKQAQELDETEWLEVSYNLAQGLRNINAIYLPEVIVLGGGIAIGRGEQLIRDVHQIMNEHLKIVPVSQIRLSGLGYNTALMGSVMLAIKGIDA
jgi:predicted NBD/HSP70 family sugar kinase